MAIGAVPPLFLLFVIFELLRFSGGAINTLANSVMVDTVPARPERFISFMHMLFSLCAIITPIISQRLYEMGGLTAVFLAIGGFGLCWEVYSAFVFLKKTRDKLAAPKLSVHQRIIGTKNILLKPGIIQILIIAIMVCAWQLAAIYYVSSYIKELSGNAADGAVALSVFFFGIMVSRLAYSTIAGKFSPGRVLMLTNLLGAIAWVAVFIVSSIIAKTVFVGLAAMFCANNIPVLFSSACKIAPKNTGAASGFVILGYYIAVFSFIPIFGALGDALGLGSAFLFVGIPLLLSIPAAFSLHKNMSAHNA